MAKDTLNPSVDTTLARKYATVGFPIRTKRRSPFSLKSVVEDAVIGEKAHTRSKQLMQYDIACNDDPGWFMVIQAPTYLDTAKYVAVSIVDSYVKDGLSAIWLTSFFKDPPPEHDLYVLDALFSDDVTSRRSRVYEIMTGLNNPNASVILLSRAPDIATSINQIGLKPHLVLSIVR